MKTTIRITSIFTAFLLLVSVFAGCSKDDSDKDTTRKTTASSGKEDESDKTTQEDKTQSPVSTKAGDIIYFGQYEQDNDLTNGKEPIAWRVLAVENGKAFLLAEKILDAKPYNVEEQDVTWEACTLRTWLNNDFYDTAFAPTDQAKIITTDVVNEDNSEYGTDGGNNTKDKVFILSVDEVTNPTYGFNSDWENDDPARRAQATDKVEEETDWWLRTPGPHQDDACHVSDDGAVYIYLLVHNTNVGVRPAMWINL